MSINISYRCG